jgi:hypothetical protein
MVNDCSVFLLLLVSIACDCNLLAAILCAPDVLANQLHLSGAVVFFYGILL